MLSSIVFEIKFLRQQLIFLCLIACVLFGACSTSQSATNITTLTSEPVLGIITPIPTVKAGTNSDITTATPDKTRDATVSTPTPIPIMVATSPLTPTAKTPITIAEEERKSIKIAYATYLNTEPLPTYQIWITTFADLTPRPLLSSQAVNPFLDSAFAWSHDGHRIAYLHLLENTIEVSIIDAVDFAEKEFIYSIIFPNELETLHYVGISGWSLEDKWIAVTLAYDSTVSGYTEKTPIVDIEGDLAMELDQSTRFMGWSPLNPEQFLYILRPNYPQQGGETVNIGNMNINEPLRTISNLDSYIPRGTSPLSPDGLKTILVVQVGNDPTNETSLLLDFQQETWQVIPNANTEGFAPSLWSPDGQWVVYIGRDGLLFLPASELNQLMIQVDSEHPFPTPLGWLPDSGDLIYQDGNMIKITNPLISERSSTFFDLTTMEVSNEVVEIVKIWIPSLEE